MSDPFSSGHINCIPTDGFFSCLGWDGMMMNDIHDGRGARKPNFKFVKGDIKSPDLLQYVIKQEDSDS